MSHLRKVLFDDFHFSMYLIINSHIFLKMPEMGFSERTQYLLFKGTPKNSKSIFFTPCPKGC